MYKVLVVDDEPWHRRGLTSLIRKIRPQYSVSEAKDGLEAFTVLSSSPIDIVITDIRMPNMDGLQLIEALGEKVKTVKIILLSVYGQFEYAQKALRLGAFEYILKPISEADVEKILNKLEGVIHKERLEFQKKEETEKQLKNLLPAYIDHLLHKWVYGKANQSELLEVFNVFPPSSIGMVITTYFVKNDIAEGDLSENDLEEIINNLKFWFHEMLKPLGHSISFMLEGKEDIMATILVLNEGNRVLANTDREVFTKIISNFKTEYGLECIVGLGSIHNDLSCNIQTSFKNAIAALSFKFFTGLGKVVAYDDYVIINHSLFFSYEEEEKLTEMIQQADRLKAHQCVCKIMQDMITEGLPNPQNIAENLILLLLGKIKLVKSNIIEEQYERLAADISFKINAAESFEEMQKVACEIVNSIIEKQEEKKNNKSEVIIQKCKKYIDEHFVEDITLEQVAQKLYFNPSYFSGFFKNYIGCSFSEYLFYRRMQKAQELLKNSEDRVYVIAGKVGYKDAGYFNRIFRKEFGLTPEEYRRLSGEL